MLALQYDRFGEPADVIALAEVADVVPGPQEVRLRVVRSPIHNHDLATIRGVYGVHPQLPAIGGSELLGVVDAIGGEVRSVTRGARVAVLTQGAWAQYVLAPADSLVPVLNAIPDDMAGQLVAMPLSAIVLFDSLRVQRGDWIVQNAANGAVGRTLMRVAQKAGVNVINLVRRETAADELRTYGAQHVVVLDDGWIERIRAFAGKSPIVRVVDSVCDEKSMALNRLLAPGGEHVIFGALGGRALTLDPGAIVFGQTSVRGFWMYPWLSRATEAQRIGAIGRLITLVAAGELPLPVAAVHPLAEAATAPREAETPGRRGKVLFAP